MGSYTTRQIVKGTFALAALIVIVEHFGGFSQVLEAGAKSYGTAYTALIGHGVK